MINKEHNSIFLELQLAHQQMVDFEKTEDYEACQKIKENLDDRLFQYSKFLSHNLPNITFNQARNSLKMLSDKIRNKCLLQE